MGLDVEQRCSVEHVDAGDVQTAPLHPVQLHDREADRVWTFRGPRREETAEPPAASGLDLKLVAGGPMKGKQQDVAVYRLVT